MNLERSTLERKDRAELATIAETLGRKPTSRAKKSDIIDLILELTGVTAVTEPAEKPKSNGTNGSNGSSRAKEAATATPEADTHDADAGDDARPARSADDRSATESSVTDREPDRDGPEHDGPDPDDQNKGGQAKGGQNQGGQYKGQNQGHSQGGQNQGQSQGGQNQGQSQGGQNQGQSQGGQNQGGGGQQDGNWTDSEAGNRRRRRRRGRDRDRPGGGEQDETVQWEGEPIDVDGLLDLRDEGYGFLRVKGFLPSRDDVYVSVKQIRQLGLRKGDHIKGASRPAGRQEKNPALLRVDLVNGKDPEQARNRPRFEDLTPLFPDQKLKLEDSQNPLDMTSRIIDLISPIGKGQRGLIVSPPKAGKTTIMKTIAKSIEHNNPEVHLIVLLVDERPEEVTDIRRTVKGDVVASTFDRPADEHTTVSELTIERAKRLVEYGQDVVIILDGITRLSRAYNLAAPATGRIMSGGIDTGALYPPKKFFGAARNVEEGGSLTILATALVDTGSKMDEVIFEEFKGTGNMELRLDRRMAEKRVYPAIDVDASSTRHEELLFERNQLQQVWKLRRVLSGLAAEGNAGASLELLIDRMKTFPSNDVFLAEIAKAPGVSS
jgi:transcription termination factor Rho